MVAVLLIVDQHQIGKVYRFGRRGLPRDVDLLYVERIANDVEAAGPYQVEVLLRETDRVCRVVGLHLHHAPFVAGERERHRAVGQQFELPVGARRGVAREVEVERSAYGYLAPQRLVVDMYAGIPVPCCAQRGAALPDDRSGYGAADLDRLRRGLLLARGKAECHGIAARLDVRRYEERHLGILALGVRRDLRLAEEDRFDHVEVRTRDRYLVAYGRAVGSRVYDDEAVVGKVHLVGRLDLHAVLLCEGYPARLRCVARGYYDRCLGRGKLVRRTVDLHFGYQVEIAARNRDLPSGHQLGGRYGGNLGLDELYGLGLDRRAVRQRERQRAVYGRCRYRSREPLSAS